MLKDSDTRRFDSLAASSRKAAILSHYSPDGDAVGSLVACAEYLSSRGVEVFPILPSPIPYNLSFLEGGTGRIAVYESEPDRVLSEVAAADLIVCLDMSCLSRTEYLADAVASSGAAKVLVDHHVRVEGDFFDLVFSTVEVSSTCELLFSLLMTLGDVSGDASKLTPLCRDALYTGMVTDTNNFSNSVFPGTFSMASSLLEAGVDKDMIQEKVFKSYSLQRMQLMGHLLHNKMRVLPRYGAAFMILTAAEKEAYLYRTGDSEGFVNIPLSVGDVKISALFTETTAGYIRVSLRSKIGTDVNALARKWYNGGGHVNASGGRLHIGIDEIESYFSKSLEDFFGK